MERGKLNCSYNFDLFVQYGHWCLWLFLEQLYFSITNQHCIGALN
jgi:hypothetical protein